MKRKLVCSWIIIFVFGFLSGGRSDPAHASGASPAIEISPEKVEIHSFYHGESLTLSGVIPAGCEPILMVLGERKEHALKRKGRVGPLWMNVGDLTVTDAPEMYYLLTSSENLEALAPADILAEHGIGYDALRQHITIEQGDSESDSMFGEFIKFKEKIGLYAISLGSVKLERDGESMMRFRATVSIPAQVPPGAYEAHVYCFAARQFTSNSSSGFRIRIISSSPM